MRHLVFYDAECPFCFYVKKSLRKLDWFNKIEWIPVQEIEEHPEDYPYMQFRHKRMYDEIHMLTTSGNLHAGFYTVRRLLMALPVTVPFSLLLYLPFIDKLGSPYYIWFSKNRYDWFGRYSEPRFE